MFGIFQPQIELNYTNFTHRIYPMNVIFWVKLQGETKEAKVNVKGQWQQQQ